MFYRAQKRTNYWGKIRKKAPKVPDITCPAIDDILNQLEKQIGKEVKQSKIGVVFHTHYSGTTFGEMQAMAGAPIKTFSRASEVAVISNDTPINEVTLTAQECTTFEQYIQRIDHLCGNCGEFLDNIVENVWTTGDSKWHVASYLKQFFNSRINELDDYEDWRLPVEDRAEDLAEKLTDKLRMQKLVYFEN